MKKLLAILLLSPLAINSQTTLQGIIYIDYNSDTKISVYCIGGYAFAQYGKTALVQIMMQSPETSRVGHAKPMKCSEYKKDK